MKLQLRFLLIITCVFVVVAGVLFIQHDFDLQRSQHILKNDLTQRKNLFVTLLNSEGSAFKTFSEDYSFWDDMVSFVKTDNIQFAQQNLDSGLSTFGADADWVYKPNGTLLYTSKNDPSVPVSTLNLTPAFFKKLTASKFIHFYQNLPGGILEVRAATIVPSDDEYHKDPPSGFWVIGRFLGSSFQSSIDSLTQSSAILESPSLGSKDILTSNSVSFAIPLEDWQGHTVELLRSTSTVTVISDLNSIYKRELLLLSIVGEVLLGLISLIIWWFILRPVEIIDQSIKKQQPEILAKLSGATSQFGNLAQTVQSFFQQKLVIQEDQFKKSELEKLNKDKGAFLSLAAHELKGPISIVKLLSEDLPKSFHGSGDTTQLFRDLDIITHQVTKMTVLINDLRLASEGKESLTFNKSTFDFDSFLQKEITSASFITDQKIIFEGGTGKQVLADPDRLSQVVTNIIRNASKYSPDSDKIIIRSSSTQDSVVVEVEDFGVGISVEDQTHIFEKYYRAPSVVGSFQGLGLGLAVCKNVLDNQGGKIWVESALGHGTHVYFSLPIAEAPQPAITPSETQVQPNSNDISPLSH